MDEQNIGKLARFMGGSSHTIKYYEKIGLLHSERDAQSNYRRYDMRICTDIVECVKYRGMGFSLKELAVLLKTANTDEHHAMIQKRIQEIAAEKERLQTVYQFLTEYEKECGRMDREDREWYVEHFDRVIYCRMQTKSLTFTEENLGDDEINIMDYAPRSMGVATLSKDYMNGGPQDFSWGQSISFEEDQPEFSGRPEFIRIAPRKVFVTYRKYEGNYVTNDEMAEDIRKIFFQYEPRFPNHVYCFRYKIVIGDDGERWSYFKIMIPLE